MRQLGEFPSRKAAQARADFLELRGIEATTRGDDDQELWVIDDDLMERALELLPEFDDSKDHAAAAQNLRKERERKARPVAMPTAAAGRPRDSAGILTLGLIVISVIVAFMSEFGETSSDVIRALLVTPITNVDIGGVMHVEWYRTLGWSSPWRLVTPMFIHFDPFHLVFNMMWLHLFGSQIEARHGTWALVALAVAAQIPGSLAQFHLSGPLFGGMSGVNFALFGFVWMQSRYGTRGYGLEGRDTVLLMGWFVLCATGLVGPIANAAHAAGLAAGLLAGMPAYWRFTRDKKVRPQFEKGSWADLNIKGWRRFERLYVQPYVPFWFMAVALAVLVLGL